MREQQLSVAGGVAVLVWESKQILRGGGGGLHGSCSVRLLVLKGGITNEEREEGLLFWVLGCRTLGTVQLFSGLMCTCTGTVGGRGGSSDLP